MTTVRPVSRHRMPPLAVGRHRRPSAAKRVGDTGVGRRLKADHLVSNSLYLLMNTVAMASLGLVFWLLCAKLYTPSEIGAGTALISASGLIGLASLLGFNGTFVRYLPTSTRRDAHVNTGLLLTGAASVALAAIYVLAVPVFAPQLRFVHDSLAMALSFIVLTAGTAMNQLTDAIFVAYRSARFNLFIDGGLQGISKIVFAVALQGIGAYGVFAAAGAAAGLAVIASVVALVRLFNYRPRWQVDREVLSEVSTYTGGMYAASLLNLSPVMLVPIIVVDRLGTADAGYFYIAFMIANVVFAAAYSVTSSLFAETSYGERPKVELVRHAGRVLLALICPGGRAAGGRRPADPGLLRRQVQRECRYGACSSRAQRTDRRRRRHLRGAAADPPEDAGSRGDDGLLRGRRDRADARVVRSRTRRRRLGLVRRQRRRAGCRPAATEAASPPHPSSTRRRRRARKRPARHP